MSEITITINRADVLDWLEDDAEMAEKYAAEIAQLTGYNVELGNAPHGHAITDWEDVADWDEIEETYQWACDTAANDWSWSE